MKNRPSRRFASNRAYKSKYELVADLNKNNKSNIKNNNSNIKQNKTIKSYKYLIESWKKEYIFVVLYNMSMLHSEDGFILERERKKEQKSKFIIFFFFYS